MSASVEWGSVIKVDGVRPSWLEPNAKRVAYSRSSYQKWFGPDEQWPDMWSERDITENSPGWDNVTAIRLPASHIAYRAIAAGFEPYADTGLPSDWDGKNVMWRDGKTGATQSYAPCWKWDTCMDEGNNVIGYRRESVAVEAVDTVTIARRTTEGWAKDYAYRGIGEFLKDHGLIIPTQAERIAAAAGLSVADVERVIAAIGECGT